MMRGRGNPVLRGWWKLIGEAALIAWMLVVGVDDLVKDGAKRRRLRRSTILDKITDTNNLISKRSRPPTDH
jgi:hypothetical protein